MTRNKHCTTLPAPSHCTAHPARHHIRICDPVSCIPYPRIHLASRRFIFIFRKLQSRLQPEAATRGQLARKQREDRESRERRKLQANSCNAQGLVLGIFAVFFNEHACLPAATVPGDGFLSKNKISDGSRERSESQIDVDSPCVCRLLIGCQKAAIDPARDPFLDPPRVISKLHLARLEPPAVTLSARPPQDQHTLPRSRQGSTSSNSPAFST